MAKLDCGDVVLYVMPSGETRPAICIEGNDDGTMTMVSFHHPRDGQKPSFIRENVPPAADKDSRDCWRWTKRTASEHLARTSSLPPRDMTIAQLRGEITQTPPAAPKDAAATAEALRKEITSSTPAPDVGGSSSSSSSSTEEKKP